jgi:hypothetical protein
LGTAVVVAIGKPFNHQGHEEPRRENQELKG